jgi:hypothetical protein
VNPPDASSTAWPRIRLPPDAPRSTALASYPCRQLTMHDDDWDDPDEFPDDEDDDGTIPCPVCGEPMFEDSPRCPACGEYVTAGSAAGPRPAWVVLTVILCLALAAWWIIGGWL